MLEQSGALRGHLKEVVGGKKGVSKKCFYPFTLAWYFIRYHTCLAPFYLALELSLLLGPVQNQNLPSRSP